MVGNIEAVVVRAFVLAISMPVNPAIIQAWRERNGGRMPKKEFEYVQREVVDMLRDCGYAL